MSITAINEELLRAIGVGIALVEFEGRRFRFFNSSFAQWFGEPEADAALEDVLEGLDIAAATAALDAERPYSQEVRIRKKRRILVIAVTLSRAVSGETPLLVVECQNISRIRELETMIDSYAKMVERNTRELEREKERVERLLLNLMPKSAYEEFKSFGVVAPQAYESVSVLLLDFVGFTQFSANTDPTVVLGELNDIFTAFDRISEQFGCERIKTIGDAYMAVAGMPVENPDHATAVAHAATRFLRYLERRNQTHQHRWEARIGLASGKAVGSIVGIQKYVYDVFGPVVNLASRLQHFARPMRIVAHADMRDSLIEEFKLEDLGDHDIRGLGQQRLMVVSTTPGVHQFSV